MTVTALTKTILCLLYTSMITLARLKNWAMEKLSTLDVSSAVKQANEIGFDHVEMIQDDKKRWAPLYRHRYEIKVQVGS